MYRLHYFPDTAPIVVRIVLEELGQKHVCHLIDRKGGALDSPSCRALQPLGKIPALETPDGPMFETAAICRVLTALKTRPAVQRVAADESLGFKPFTNLT